MGINVRSCRLIVKITLDLLCKLIWTHLMIIFATLHEEKSIGLNNSFTYWLLTNFNPLSTRDSKFKSPIHYFITSSRNNQSTWILLFRIIILDTNEIYLDRICIAETKTNPEEHAVISGIEWLAHGTVSGRNSKHAAVKIIMASTQSTADGRHYKALKYIYRERKVHFKINFWKERKVR